MKKIMEQRIIFKVNRLETTSSDDEDTSLLYCILLYDYLYWS
ncbi:hypothetical protein [Paenibacillus sp. 2TAB26]